MLSIYFTTVVPNEQIKPLIHAFQALGFKYDRVFQGGETSLHKLIGTYSQLQNIASVGGVQIVFDSSVLREKFINGLNGNVEFVFYGERRKNDY